MFPCGPGAHDLVDCGCQDFDAELGGCGGVEGDAFVGWGFAPYGYYCGLHGCCHCGCLVIFFVGEGVVGGWWAGGGRGVG